MPGKPLILPSTVQLLRFHFSLFLMPVFWFALSVVPHIQFADTLLVFFILHVLLYPASNGYNSYMDRDIGSIGGVEKPLQPTRQLLHTTIVMDVAAVMLSFGVSLFFAAGILAYILMSRAYSYRPIRLKKYPVAGYLTVVIFQGCVTFMLVYHGCSGAASATIPWLPVVTAGLLIGGFYPLTQIYQHEDDRKDGVTTISYLLGYRGSFVFCAVVYGLATFLLLYYFHSIQADHLSFIFLSCMAPVVGYFLYWAFKVWQDEQNANFRYTMRMNSIASLCTNLAFIIICIKNHF